ncbi:MAG: hypothetical protein K0M40_14165 [Prolixibacteraceae bacterium]|nr:hypothetical protein [Prolixibacteraceae bacterium]
MIAISTETVKQVFLLYKTEIDNIIAEKRQAVDDFLNDRSKSHNSKQKQYLTKIINDFEKIVLATPAEIEVYSNNSLKAIPKLWKNGVNKQISFKDGLLKALNYNDLRSSFYPKYFHKIGIKACVYCNSQLTVSTENDGNVSAKFQVDHYLDKASFPCFSISFFNLYPTCASCNNIKRNKAVNFFLYSEDSTSTAKSEFNFCFKPGSVAKYLASHSIEDIELVFTEPNGDFQKTFDIEGIYNTQKDIAEELILKSKVYSKAYQNSLIKSFPAIFTNASLSNRILIGTYCEENEIHKRPMSKFMQDIAEDLGMIQKSKK